jgi:DNA/RNA-binding domain of Phe-tRNA-synthetase-like protein
VSDRLTPSASELAASGERLEAIEGFVEPGLARELPGLRLAWLAVEARLRRSPPELRHRLLALSNRFRGASIVALRTQPVPHAYRAFFRQIGLDPDTDRVPIERAALARLMDGQFRSQGLIDDALLIALVETGVPVWALDAARVSPGGLGIRLSAAGERLGEGELAQHLAAQRLVVADSERVHALLFGPLGAGHEVGGRTRQVILFSVGVGGVPAIHIEEALWLAAECLQLGTSGS